MRFTINTYSARGHAQGSGGNGEKRGSGGSARVWVPDEELEERVVGATAIKSERDKFIDEVLAKIALREAIQAIQSAIQSANAEDSQSAAELAKERQSKRKRAA